MSIAGCSICLDHLSSETENRILPCGHVFHHKCIYKWIEKHKKCCSCSQSTDLNQIERVYLNFSDDKGSLNTIIEAVEKHQQEKNQLSKELEETKKNIAELETEIIMLTKKVT